MVTITEDRDFDFFDTDIYNSLTFRDLVILLGRVESPVTVKKYKGDAHILYRRKDSYGGLIGQYALDAPEDRDLFGFIPRSRIWSDQFFYHDSDGDYGKSFLLDLLYYLKRNAVSYCVVTEAMEPSDHIPTPLHIARFNSLTGEERLELPE